MPSCKEIRPVLYIVLVIVFFQLSPVHADSSIQTPLHYNQVTLSEIDRELAANGNNGQYGAVLRGLRWCIIFNENDGNFDYTFTNYITMLDELTLSGSHPALDRIAHNLILKEINRATLRLEKMFSKDEQGLSDFISILPIIYRHKAPVTPFKEFADKYFAKIVPADQLREFRQAASELNYDLLTDLIVDAAFIDMAYHSGVAGDFNLPPNNFQTIMDECAKVNFLRKVGDDDFHDQNYYATHVILALTHYGQQSLNSSLTSDSVFLYLAGQYHIVRYQVNDLDLLCEYLYCFRKFGIGGFDFVREGERHILSLQNNDGSWGTPDDKEGDAYDRLHPTWTAITLLVLGNDT